MVGASGGWGVGERVEGRLSPLAPVAYHLRYRSFLLTHSHTYIIVSLVAAPSQLTSTIPIRCIERHPTTQTVWFQGQPINLSMISNSYVPPLDKGYLSYIFRGQRTPSTLYARKIAAALGMQLQAFLDGLEREASVQSFLLTDSHT